MTNTSDISEQVILITGASAGIGAGLAETLATQFKGIRLVLAARNQEKLEKVANNCRQTGAEVLIVPTDMADTAQVRALATKAIEHFGYVSAVVNNAGYGQMGPIELISPDAAKHQFAVNFHGPLTLIQALIPMMRDRGDGRIINISSLGGRMAFPVVGMYSCSKFALEALSDILRMELKAFNIKVSVVIPGPVKTEFFDAVNQKVERDITSPQKSLYRIAFETIKGLEEQTEILGWSSQRIAKVIIRALVAKNPLPRYIAATGGEIFIFLMTKILPTWLTDFIWKRFYKIDRLEKEWKQSKILTN